MGVKRFGGACSLPVQGGRGMLIGNVNTHLTEECQNPDHRMNKQVIEEASKR
jgi:hypothetical protein